MIRNASKPSTTPQAIAYVRVSTDEQAREGVSLDAQRSKIMSWCGAMGYELVRTFADEGISGHSIEKRAGLQAAVDAVCASGGVLVVYSLSRLARNTRETLELSERLSKAGADLVSLSEKIDTTSAAGKMIFRLLAVLAEFEWDQVSERTSMALQYKKAQGERIGSVAYGYELDADGIRLLANSQEQAVISLARMYADHGLSLRKIAARLADEGYLSRSGKPFVPAAIANMVAVAA